MQGVDRLTHFLRGRGLRSGREIQAGLGISQPMLSRLIQEAGPRISRFGRSVATRYALAREIPGVGPRSPVYRVDEAGSVSEHGVMHWLADNGCWLERSAGDSQFYGGLPPFAADISPQGFIGRHFPTTYPDLDLPARVHFWDNDDRIIALAHRGEDCVGNLIIGDVSLDRFLEQDRGSRDRSDYPSLVADVLNGQAGSSAGGEQPKFATYSGGRHLLVKFMSGDGSAADRWRDLLVAERLALEVLRAAGFATPRADWFDLDGCRYLEVERFDRVGPKGRRGVVSLQAVVCEFLGEDPRRWSSAVPRIAEHPSLTLSRGDADRIVWLDLFGELIGNVDRHSGNLRFFAEDAWEMHLSLAPVYDMLPMIFAPAGSILVNRRFAPSPPTPQNHDVWFEAASRAREYWEILHDEEGLTADFRRLVGECRRTLIHLIHQSS